MSIPQRDFKERIQQQKSAQNKLRDQRQQIARAKKYYDDYHVQHRARLMRARTKEERVSSDARADAGLPGLGHKSENSFPTLRNVFMDHRHVILQRLKAVS